MTLGVASTGSAEGATAVVVPVVPVVVGVVGTVVGRGRRRAPAWPRTAQREGPGHGTPDRLLGGDHVRRPRRSRDR